MKFSSDAGSGSPNITGSPGCPAERREKTGAFYESGTGVTEGHEYSVSSCAFDASLSNSLFGKSETIQPLSILFLPCIKS